MKPLQIIAGVLAGAVGAAIWAAISYYANLEIGYVAWGIGILVGIAVAATGENGVPAGIAAVLITIVALLAGKLAAVEIAVQDMRGEMESWTDVDSEMSDEDLTAHIAGKIASEREAAGETVDWPEVDYEQDVPLAETYPQNIWQQANKQLKSMNPEQQDAVREEAMAARREFAETMGNALAGAAREEGFMASFGVLDLIFFGLAIITAWGIATREE